MSFNPLTLVPGCLAIIAFIAFCTNDKDCKKMFKGLKRNVEDTKREVKYAAQDTLRGEPPDMTTQIKRETDQVITRGKRLGQDLFGSKKKRSQRRNTRNRNTRRNKSKKITKKTKRNKSKRRSRKNK
jgi:hypothetical protein